MVNNTIYDRYIVIREFVLSSFSKTQEYLYDIHNLLLGGLDVLIAKERFQKSFHAVGLAPACVHTSMIDQH